MPNIQRAKELKTVLKGEWMDLRLTDGKKEDWNTYVAVSVAYV